MSPTKFEVINSSWRPLLPMYSSLLHVVTSEPLVVHVKIVSRPGHAYFPSSKVDVIVWQEYKCNRTLAA